MPIGEPKAWREFAEFVAERTRSGDRRDFLCNYLDNERAVNWNGCMDYAPAGGWPRLEMYRRICEHVQIADNDGCDDATLHDARDDNSARVIFCLLMAYEAAE